MFISLIGSASCLVQIAPTYPKELGRNVQAAISYVRHMSAADSMDPPDQIFINQF